MYNTILLASHLAVTLIAVFSIAIRNEHRLTKIETDVAWLKSNINSNCEGTNEDGKDS